MTRLRSYSIPRGSSEDPTIVEAALATSAAPTYFSEAIIGGTHYVDGAIGANNPAVQVEEEAADLWCEETGNIKPLVKCFVSVGTGHPGIRSVSDKGLKNFLDTLRKEATETESTNQQWLSQWRAHVDQGRCFRFNVNHGLDAVGLAEFKEDRLIKQASLSYLEEMGTRVDIRTCVNNLRLKECT
jgi:predicted acylesterase/phospholipase RssA